MAPSFALMDAPHLIISNPPHDAGDLRPVAPCFGLSVAEVRMKTNYRVPEIWFAERDPHEVEPINALLTEAGLKTVVRTQMDLAQVPPQTQVESFSFAETGLVARWDDSEVTIPYDAETIAVFCQPGGDVAESESSGRGLSARLSHGSAYTGTHGRSSLSSLASQLSATHSSTFLDLYVALDGDLQRISFVEATVDFAGLHMRLPRATDNMVMFVAECEDRFTNAQFDRRLVGMLLRKRRTAPTQPPPQTSGQRRRLSFATPALTDLLEKVSDDLKDASQPDFSSRLVYLTKR